MTTAMKTATASEQITAEVTSWPGVEAGPGTRGEFSFKLGRREIGHLHGDRVLHIGFPKAVWRELYDQGRIDYHPVFPGKPGYASRAIENEGDVRDVIALLRLNYDRAVARHGVPDSLDGLHAFPPDALPFAPSLEVRAFLLPRQQGNVLVYSTAGLGDQAETAHAMGGVSRHYLNHRHEAMFFSQPAAVPLFTHREERESVEGSARVRGTFSKRHMLDEDFEVIPTPGHTAGATAYLWDSGKRRFLFTGDTIYLDEGEWVAAVLESSDREAYVESLELIRELAFDVLVPWAATRGRRYYALTDGTDTHRRIDAIIERLRRGEDR